MAAPTDPDEEGLGPSGKRRRRRAKSTAKGAAKGTTSLVALRVRRHAALAERIALDDDAYRESAERAGVGPGSDFFRALADHMANAAPRGHELRVRLPATAIVGPGGMRVLHTDARGRVQLTDGASVRVAARLIAASSGGGTPDDGTPAAVVKQSHALNAGTVKTVGSDAVRQALVRAIKAAKTAPKKTGEGAGGAVIPHFQCIQAFVRPKGPCPHIIRVLWRGRFPPKVWKVEGAAKVSARPTIPDAGDARACAIQEVAGSHWHTAVGVAGELAACFGRFKSLAGGKPNASHVGAEQTSLSLHVAEFAVDLIEDARGEWNLIQVKAFRLAPTIGARPPSARRSTDPHEAASHHARFFRGDKQACRGDYCGTLRAVECGAPLASSRAPPPVTIDAYAFRNLPASTAPSHSPSSHNGTPPLTDEASLDSGPTLFQIPFKHILTDRTGGYAECLRVRWMFRNAWDEWESFPAGVGATIEQAFQQGTKYFKIGAMQTLAFGDGDEGSVLEDEGKPDAPCAVRRHPPFCTQQYLPKPSRCLGVSPMDRGRMYDLVDVCEECYRVYLCKEHMKLQSR